MGLYFLNSLSEIENLSFMRVTKILAFGRCHQMFKNLKFCWFTPEATNSPFQRSEQLVEGDGRKQKYEWYIQG